MVTTPGSWEEGFHLHENRTPSHEMARPRKGGLRIRDLGLHA